MDHAWLDSLSEDWVSQPRSSGSPVPSLPSLSDSTSGSSQHVKSSRIPRYDSEKQTWTAPQSSSNSPLSERSPNDHNISKSQRFPRRPSKLRGEISNDIRGRQLSRTVSVSTTHSTQHHTIEHKSVSLSPNKGPYETPEWKRRLLHGDVAYGEQRDLFSPAGLENIFQPPPTRPSVPKNATFSGLQEESIVLPSSPPPYNVGSRMPGVERNALYDEESGEQNDKAHPQPRMMKYNLVDEAESDFSSNDLDQSGRFHLVSPGFRAKPDQFTQSNAPSILESSVAKEPDQVEKRTASGQSDIRNEEFSPVFVSSHNTINGKVDCASLNLPPAELQRQLRRAKEGSCQEAGQNRDDRSCETPVINMTESGRFAQDGCFVNTRRGGYSQDGSFQNRMLSSSSFPAIDDSAMLPEESLQASTPKDLPVIRKARQSGEIREREGAPDPKNGSRTPPSSPEKEGQKSSGGSPLKLFDNYDTFTNQKLLRRLSQFENAYNSEHSDGGIPSPESTREGFIGVPLGVPNQQETIEYDELPTKPARKVTSFGEGDLDAYQFSEEVSYHHDTGLQDDGMENGSVPGPHLNSNLAFKFHLGPSPALIDEKTAAERDYGNASTGRTKDFMNARTTRRFSTSSPAAEDASSWQIVEDLQTPRKRFGDAEGKRLPKSPLKDPTPKRRRTLHETEISHAKIDHESPDINSLKHSHQQMQSIISRKRKDARYNDDQQAANPNVLAMRQILRPRTPTPSQKGTLQIDRQQLQGLNLDPPKQISQLQAQKLALVQAELDSVESRKASPALGGSRLMQDESRKGSVTTQDFLDEAKKIMAGIRGKTRSGLASVEESESDNDRNIGPDNGSPDSDLEDSYQDSTKEPFSRPPSREGKPVQRLPTKQEDPAVLDHLRKYQEMSDMDLVIASSMKSIAMAKEATQAVRELERMTDETLSRSSEQLRRQEHVVDSDPPNIRISENPDLQRKRKHSTSSTSPSMDSHPEAEFPSQGSNASSSQSTSRSIPTGSSRGSDSRRVIAPHTVSHLIPEQLAGMMFDRERNIWIKRKTVSNESAGLNVTHSEDTEEDPFGDIPDLSVDETQEIQRLKAVAAKKKEEVRAAQEEFDAGPHSAPGAGSQPKSSLQSQPYERLVEQEQITMEVEKEISIHEDRIEYSATPRQRNVTISFSSPVASVIQPVSYEDGYDRYREEDESNLSVNHDEADLSNDSIIITKQASSHKSSSRKMRTALRNTSRKQSLGGHTFSARPVSRIDEQDEDTIGQSEEGLGRSISLLVTTPMHSVRATSLALATPQIMQSIGDLSLTPLSEFTMHQVDESFGLDVTYIQGGQRYALENSNKKTLSLSIKELVEKITQVEPYEPFWEHMKLLDLKDKRLANLHKLDEFCEQLEELEASHNQVSQLHGVPKSVRHLRITHNQLSDMAAWGHLQNLQYVDVSNNELESLSGFGSLVHLRALKADNNQIKSLDGVSQLDGLLSLRVRGNMIKSLDFAGTKLQRLTDLDLRNNHINQIQNLQDLPSLSSINIEDNNLSEFSACGVHTLGALKYLKLGGNDLAKIDVSQYPNLRLLYLDRNRLGIVTGLLKTKHLDSLSMREQQEGSFIDTSFLHEAFELRKLYLSGNLLTTFQPQVDFLNLQYLELANCGLETLPPEFGHMVPNTRVLNLNFNALRDIKPLLGISRLKRLHLAGNRLLRLRTTTCVLSQFPGLSNVDLRNNPLTLGFYPPSLETRLVLRPDAEEEAAGKDIFTLSEADRIRDTKYVSCLDMETKMRRRVYEILMLSGCWRAKTVDGLRVDRSVADLKDSVWSSLIQAGVLRECVNATTQDAQRCHVGLSNGEDGLEADVTEKSIRSEAWQAEDSFA